jgi:hypothetical protein
MKDFPMKYCGPELRPFNELVIMGLELARYILDNTEVNTAIKTGGVKGIF